MTQISRPRLIGQKPVRKANKKLASNYLLLYRMVLIHDLFI